MTRGCRRGNEGKRDVIARSSITPSPWVSGLDRGRCRKKAMALSRAIDVAAQGRGEGDLSRFGRTRFAADWDAGCSAVRRDSRAHALPASERQGASQLLVETASHLQCRHAHGAHSGRHDPACRNRRKSGCASNLQACWFEERPEGEVRTRHADTPGWCRFQRLCRRRPRCTPSRAVIPETAMVPLEALIADILELGYDRRFRPRTDRPAHRWRKVRTGSRQTRGRAPV